MYKECGYSICGIEFTTVDKADKQQQTYAG